MAISSYSTLQDSVGTKLDRSAYQSGGASAARTEEWIDLCEARMNRNIRDRQMSTKGSIVQTASTEYTNLPDNFGGLVSIRYTDTTRNPLRYYPADAAERRSLTQAGVPKYFTIENNQVRWVPVPETTTTLEIIYYLRIPALSDSATSNWVLDDNPDAYLYGTLYQGMIELEYPPDKILGVKLLFDEAMAEVSEMDKFNRYPPGLLRMNKEFAAP